MFEMSADNFELYKTKIALVDNVTQNLISNGVQWPPQSPIATMSLSDAAQRNWIALMVVSGYLTYPFPITTQDDVEYSFSSAEELQQFCMYCMQVVNGHIASGRALKINMNNAATQEELDLIVDNR